NRPEILEAIDRRLRHFSLPFSAMSMLRLDYRIVSKTSGHAIAVPTTASRPLVTMTVDGSRFDVMYSDHDDQLYLSFGDVIRALVDGPTGSTTVSAVEGASTWLLSHPFLSLALFEGLRRNGLYPLHAAALSTGGIGLLVAGISGAGKSTLALALARAGLDYLGDDTILLAVENSSVTAFAFPDELDISRHTAAFFPELAGLAHTPPPGDRPKHGIFVDEVYSTKVVARCVPSLLVLPRIADVPVSTLLETDAEEIFVELVHNVLVTHTAVAKGHLDAIAALIRQVRCYRLETGRDLDAIALQLRELIGRTGHASR